MATSDNMNQYLLIKVWVIVELLKLLDWMLIYDMATKLIETITMLIIVTATTAIATKIIKTILCEHWGVTIRPLVLDLGSSTIKGIL